MTDTLDQQCIDTLRFLSVDMVQKANSGHPGPAARRRADGLRAVDALPEAQPGAIRSGPTATASCSRPGTARRCSTACCT